jgi:DNA invertase Pin-like site-specific DNA recombinase
MTFHNIGYGRVSKLDLDRMGDSENQLDIAANQQRRRLEKAGCTEIFFDVQSGADDDRPKFEELLNRIKRKQNCDRVTVTRDDRLTRNTEMMLSILKLMRDQRIEYLVLDDGDRPADLTNPYEWKRRSLAGVDAQFEREMLSMRIKRGFEDLRSQQKANHKTPFGFVRTREGKYAPHPVEYDHLRWIIEDLLNSKSVYKTCRNLNSRFNYTWGHSRFRRLLLNQVLRGHTPRFVNPATGLPDEVQQDTHPEIKVISPDEDLIIQQILKEASQYRGANQSAPRYPLGSGLCHCARCGSSMSCRKRKHKSGNIYIYLECDSATEYSNPNRCENMHSINADNVEKKIIEALCNKAEQLAEISTTSEEITESFELQSLRRQVNDLKKIPGRSAPIIKAIEELELQILEIEKEINASGQQLSLSRDAFISYGKVTADPNFWWGLPAEEKRYLYRSFISDVRINGKKRPSSRFVDYSIEVLLRF